MDGRVKPGHDDVNMDAIGFDNQSLFTGKGYVDGAGDDFRRPDSDFAATLLRHQDARLIRHQAICLQHPLQDFFILGRSQI